MDPKKIELRSRIKRNFLADRSRDLDRDSVSNHRDSPERQTSEQDDSCRSSSKRSAISTGGIARILENAMRKQGLGQWNRQTSNRDEDFGLFREPPYLGMESFSLPEQRQFSVDSIEKQGSREEMIADTSEQFFQSPTSFGRNEHADGEESPDKKIRKPPPIPSFVRSGSNSFQLKSDILAGPKGQTRPILFQKSFHQSRNSAGLSNQQSGDDSSSSCESTDSSKNFFKFRNLKTRLSNIMKTAEDPDASASMIGFKSAPQPADGLIRVVGRFGKCDPKFRSSVTKNGALKDGPILRQPHLNAPVVSNIQVGGNVAKNYDKRDQEALRMISSIPGMMRIKIVEKQQECEVNQPAAAKQATKLNHLQRPGSSQGLIKTQGDCAEGFVNGATSSFNIALNSEQMSPMVFRKKSNMLSPSSVNLKKGPLSSQDLGLDGSAPGIETRSGQNKISNQSLKLRLGSEDGQPKPPSSKPTSIKALKLSTLSQSPKVPKFVTGTPSQLAKDKPVVLDLASAGTGQLQLFFGGAAKSKGLSANSQNRRRMSSSTHASPVRS